MYERILVPLENSDFDDAIIMSTHGHKGVQDLLRGSVANDVRHLTNVPILLVRGAQRRAPQA